MLAICRGDAPDATPWAIMVSEFMLQQTPVERVRGPWQAWLERWPTPASLAAASPGEAVRAWGRLGYPRRALRLHQAARMITDDFNGQVPRDRESLLRLPGVGSYHRCGDRKLRPRPSGDRSRYQRVAGYSLRVALGAAFPSATQTTPWNELSPSSLHRVRRIARHAGPLPRWSLGALVCRARSPRCDACPVADLVRLAAGRQSSLGRRPRRGQDVHGDRSAVPGSLLAVLRSSDDPIDDHQLARGVARCRSANARWPRSSRTGWSWPRAARGRCQARFLEIDQKGTR